MSTDFWAGYISGAASIVAGNPLDLIKVRLQATNRGISVAKPQTWQSIKTLTAGLPAPILTYGALNALLFTTYHRCLRDFDHLVVPTEADGDSFETPLWSHFLAGAAAGFATFFISTPTEYIKCRIQLANTSPRAASLGLARQEQSSFSIATQTVRECGITGLFLGGMVTSLRDAIGYGFWFVTYEASKDLWDRQRNANPSKPGRNTSQDAFKTLLCGGLAGVATWTSVYPLDVIKTRVQTQPLQIFGTSLSETSLLPASHDKVTRTQGAWSLARQAYVQEGTLVFWRGLSVCCLRAFIVNAIQWSAYEWAMKYFS